MARTAKATSIRRPVTVGRKPGRPKGAPSKTTTKIAKPSTAPKRAVTAAPGIPKLTKDELRARVEQLERANTTLRAKGREANRVAKTAAARIAELEDHVAQLKQQASPPAPAKRSPRPAAPARAKRQHRDEPAALDEEAETASKNPEEHLKPE
jgi:hypothetical protein